MVMNIVRPLSRQLLLFYLMVAVFGCLSAEAAQSEKDGCAGSKTENTLLTCRQKQFANSEAALKSVLASLKSNYEAEEPELAKLLADAQAKWQLYRDAECLVVTFESSSGTAYEVYKLDCLNKLNLKRLADMKALQSAP